MHAKQCDISSTTITPKCTTEGCTKSEMSINNKTVSVGVCCCTTDHCNDATHYHPDYKETSSNHVNKCYKNSESTELNEVVCAADRNFACMTVGFSCCHLEAQVIRRPSQNLQKRRKRRRNLN